MDVSDFMKHAIPKIEVGRKIDTIRQAIKSERYAEQDKREALKETFKPVTDKLEEEIGELTDEIKELKMLPAIKGPEAAIEAPGPSTPQAAIEAKPKEDAAMVDFDGNFTREDLEEIRSHGFPLPSLLFDTRNPEKVKEVSKGVGSKMQSLGGKKSAAQKKGDKGKVKALDQEMDNLREYKKLIGTFTEGFKLTKHKGSGIRNSGVYPAYTQPKRNAYKIAKNGKYGKLMIDLPGLLGHLQLTATKDGKKVLDKVVDFDTIDLLTKRFNGKKEYSPLSRLVFDELNTLGELPIHKTSKKYSKIGSGVVYYRDPGDLLDRLKLLGGSIKAGNNSAVNEFSAVVHKLRKLGEITADQLKSTLRKYVNPQQSKVPG